MNSRQDKLIEMSNKRVVEAQQRVDELREKIAFREQYVHSKAEMDFGGKAFIGIVLVGMLLSITIPELTLLAVMATAATIAWMLYRAYDLNSEKASTDHMRDITLPQSCLDLQHEIADCQNMETAIEQAQNMERPLEKVLQALRGDADAQYELGAEGYDEFSGDKQTFEQCYDEAIEWLSMAAAQGHIEAQFDLAVCLGQRWLEKCCPCDSSMEDERDLRTQPDKNMTESVKWFHSAAAGGHIKAQTVVTTLDNGETLAVALRPLIASYATCWHGYNFDDAEDEDDG